jgi:crotonobetainyl-CoA:carnitine CoA-transferase CaiB-like acyl-CoA transferase
MPSVADFRPPLAGIRVLDFGRYIAGPYCAALLADYGADVIRIEKEAGSEDRFVTPVCANGDGALFLQMNRNKRGMAYDPGSVRGRAITRKLVALADIIVANLPDATLERMGLSYDQLCAVKPEVILVTMSAFGTEGPWKERLGFDSIGQAMCGAAYLSGTPEGPARTQVSWVDFSTAVHCAYGALLALRHRDQTGRGQHVQGSLLASAINGANAQIIEQALTAPHRPPIGSDAAGAAPIGFFETRDGWIVVHVVGQPIFDRLAGLLRRTDWLTDPHYASDLLRGDNRAPILAEMRDWCAARSCDEAIRALSDARIPAGPVLAPADVLANEQVAAANIFNFQNSESAVGAVPIARSPIRLSGYEPDCRPAPHLGADTDGILADIDIARFL